MENKKFIDLEFVSQQQRDVTTDLDVTLFDHNDNTDMRTRNVLINALIPDPTDSTNPLKARVLMPEDLFEVGGPRANNLGTFNIGVRLNNSGGKGSYVHSAPFPVTFEPEKLHTVTIS